jgi:hypothetical protein
LHNLLFLHLPFVFDYIASVFLNTGKAPKFVIRNADDNSSEFSQSLSVYNNDKEEMPSSSNEQNQTFTRDDIKGSTLRMEHKTESSSRFMRKDRRSLLRSSFVRVYTNEVIKKPFIGSFYFVSVFIFLFNC